MFINTLNCCTFLSLTCCKPPLDGRRTAGNWPLMSAVISSVH